MQVGGGTGQTIVAELTCTGVSSLPLHLVDYNGIIKRQATWAMKTIHITSDGTNHEILSLIWQSVVSVLI
jgi:hypothetical protein